MIINCRSIRSQSKRINLATLLSDHQIDIILGCESHLDHSFLSSEILPSDYTIFRKDRTLGGGGVFIGIRNCLTAMADSSLSTDTELIWIKLLTLNNRSVYICSYYRPPNNDLNSTIQLRKSLETLHTNHQFNSSIIILGGDFNLPDISWENGCGRVNPSPSYGTEINNSLLDIVSDYHLEQLVNETTQENHILDLLFCSHLSMISEVLTTPGISDHEAVLFQLNLKSVLYRNPDHNIYLYHKGNYENIQKCIADFRETWLSTNPYNNTLEHN